MTRDSITNPLKEGGWAKKQLRKTLGGWHRKEEEKLRCTSTLNAGFPHLSSTCIGFPPISSSVKRPDG